MPDLSQLTLEDRKKIHEAAKSLLSETPELANELRSSPLDLQVSELVKSPNVFNPIDCNIAGEAKSELGDLVFETIALAKGRPVLTIQRNDFEISFTDPVSEFWTDVLKGARSNLKRVIPSVGRVEVDNHPFYSWIGTAWLVDDEIIVTNRHVALEFARDDSDKFVFRVGKDLRNQISPRVDFLEEFKVDDKLEFRLVQVLHIEPEPGPDMAFVKIERGSGDQKLATPIRLATATDKVEYVAAIGYPARDSRVPDQRLVLSVFGDEVYDKKRLSPGTIKRITSDFIAHTCSTLGGNSGSVVVDLASGDAVGLHFGGLFLEENRAVPVRTIADRLKTIRSNGKRPSPARVNPKVPRQGERPAANAAHGDGGERDQLGTVSSQGESVTWTIPLHVTIQVGTGRISSVSGVAGDDAFAGTTRPGGPATKESLTRAVERARTNLSGRSDVVGVRLGYRFREGKITKERAIVVLVRQKLGEEALRAEGIDPLPSKIDGVPVDVSPVTPFDLILLSELPASIALEKIPVTHYLPPDGELHEINEEMRLICHVSPDQGWPHLSRFLAGTKKRLTVGMYDFTAPHILDAVIGAVKSRTRKMNLVIQRGESVGSGAKKNDLKDAEVVQQIADELGNRFQQAWASVTGPGRLFGSSYHIKVAVRDGTSFWLSSGNWQSSNQPPVDPVADGETTSQSLNRYNRDWHVIVENKALAEQFERYLLHDLEQAAPLDQESLVEDPVLLFPKGYFDLVEEATEAAAHYFPAKEFNKQLRVMPLLTPDNYAEKVLDLIKGAKKAVLFQNQSFNLLGDQNDARFEELADALLRKQKAGLDVRIIIRGDFNPRPILERLQEFGFDMERVRAQKKCHTKGIMVDSKRVLIGSHNWTNQGTLVNRDASLIIHDAEVTEYFQEIFEFDWERIGALRIDEESPGIELASSTAESTNGRIAVPWTEIIGG